MMSLWRRIAQVEVKTNDALNEFILNTITTSDLINTLPTVVLRVAAELPQYSKKLYKADIKVLCPLIDANIPPAEHLNRRGLPTPASFVGILNAGWKSYVEGLDAFRANLPPGKYFSDFYVARQFNRFLLKAMELSETIHAWHNTEISL